jgi:hypothetical protein
VPRVSVSREDPLVTPVEAGFISTGDGGERFITLGMKFRASDAVVREHPELFLPADSSDGEILEARRARYAARGLPGYS